MVYFENIINENIIIFYIQYFLLYLRKLFFNNKNIYLLVGQYKISSCKQSDYSILNLISRFIYRE